MKRLFIVPALILMFTALSCTDYTGNEVTVPDYGLDNSVTLSVVAPAESENIKPGTTYTIKWNVPSAINTVSVSLYRKNVFQSVILENAPNTGKAEWTVPADIFNSVHYTLRICDPRFPDIYYSYSKNFYIKAEL